MLQKVAQDRLDKVLSIIEVSNFRFVNKELSESLGIGKGTVSDYLSGAKPMSKPFYELFMKKYSNSNLGNADAETNNPLIESSKNDDFDIKETMRNLSESNINLAIAFVKQATAHEKDAEARVIHAAAHEKEADARIIQATANKILVEVNRDALSKIPSYQSGAQDQKQDSLQLSQTLDQMAGVDDIPEAEMATFEGRRKFYHRIFALSQNPKNASGKKNFEHRPSKQDKT